MIEVRSVWSLGGVIILVWITAAVFWRQDATAQAPSQLTPQQEASARPAIQHFQQSSAGFVENKGQWSDSSIRFATNGGGVNVGLTSTTLQFRLVQRRAEGSGSIGAAGSVPRDRVSRHAQVEDRPTSVAFRRTAFSARLAGARAIMPMGDEKTSATINFHRGDPKLWREGVPAWKAVTYKGIYDGIDLRVESRSAAGIKYEFIVAAGGDWRRIEFQYEGIAGLNIGTDGALELTPAEGWSPLTDAAPVAWQMIDGVRRAVDVQFVLRGAIACGFKITGDYDARQPLVIDPELVWSTYLGGSHIDYGRGIAVDSSSNIYVAGSTDSSGWTMGGFDTSYNGNTDDAFVAKLSNTGGFLWSTYLGGSDWDTGAGIAVDRSGNVYITGNTYSSGWTSNGFDTTYHGARDAFVVKLSNLGGFLWSTYLGGSDYDTGAGIAVDDSGNIYVTGETMSPGWISGGFDTTYNGSTDAFVVKLSSSGGRLWSTYLGGSGGDYGRDIAVDGSGNFYVTGATESSGWTLGGFDTSYNGNIDVFIAKLSSAGRFLWSTYLGGSSGDVGLCIALDRMGSIYVGGMTKSSGWTSGGFDTSYNGNSDAFIAKLSNTGGYLWSTYLGGKNDDYTFDIAVDGSGRIYATGMTSSSGWTSGGFDTNFDNYKPYPGGGVTVFPDVFLAMLSSSGKHEWSTYMGGSGGNYGRGISLDNSGNIYVTGETDGSGWTSGGFDTSFNNVTDVFVAKIRFQKNGVTWEWRRMR